MTQNWQPYARSALKAQLEEAREQLSRLEAELISDTRSKLDTIRRMLEVQAEAKKRRNVQSIAQSGAGRV